MKHCEKTGYLTETAYSSIELESRGTVERWSISRHPLSSVRGHFTRLKASIVEKPATRQIVGFRTQSTTHIPRRIAHFDFREIFRYNSNVFIQQVLFATLWQPKTILYKLSHLL